MAKVMKGEMMSIFSDSNVFSNDLITMAKVSTKKSWASVDSNWSLFPLAKLFDIALRNS